MEVCQALNKPIVNDKGAVIFDCPSCGKSKIVRSAKARQIVAEYKCHECGFTGPN